MNADVVDSVDRLTYWHPGLECCDAEWEAAYARFESPEQEIAKFAGRFKKMGIDQWPRNIEIGELFCGRGNGLVTLERLGFRNLFGVDLAPSLLRQYRGPARLFVADCRELQFEDASLDAVVIQGGLHHLPDVKRDLPEVLDEIRRVLRPDGRVMIVEPWMTPFLAVTHFLADRAPVRMLSPKFGALHDMIVRERTTYFAWLSLPRLILDMIHSRFSTEKMCITLGKLMFVGRKSEQ